MVLEDEWTEWQKTLIQVRNRYVIPRSLGHGVEDEPRLGLGVAEAKPRVSLRIAAATCDHKPKGQGLFVVPRRGRDLFAWHKMQLPDACHTHRPFASSPESLGPVDIDRLHEDDKNSRDLQIWWLDCLQLPTAILSALLPALRIHVHATGRLAVEGTESGLQSRLQRYQRHGWITGLREQL